ncbi:unnamed protein product [Mycena citricolor]|uniref:Uncharacterized protein n=1 Tax=Mycena citricolor TaxID=2018698 RepID=A0AAD2HY82_9AGAR|nr:unnamed protein product [Mycena citricolor]
MTQKKKKKKSIQHAREQKGRRRQESLDQQRREHEERLAEATERGECLWDGTVNHGSVFDVDCVPEFIDLDDTDDEDEDSLGDGSTSTTPENGSIKRFDGWRPMDWVSGPRMHN